MKHILLIDDDEGILDAVSLLLEEMEYRVSTLMHGEKAVETITTLMPDLILLDIYMSGSDGRDICRLLKKNPKTKNIPVIIVAAHPHVAKEAGACGAEDFLAKPFTMQDLLNRIEKNIS